MINLTYEKFNEIIKSASGICKDTPSAYTSYIHIEVNAAKQELTAVALTPVKMSVYRTSVAANEDMTFDLPFMKPLHKSAAFAEISLTEDELHIKTALNTIVFNRYKGFYPEWQKICNRIIPKDAAPASVYVSVDHLKNILKCVQKGNDLIRLDVFGEKISLEAKTASGMFILLPVSANEEMKKGLEWQI